MRNIKTIKIDDREITVKELRTKDIRRILAAAEDGDLAFAGKVAELLPLATDAGLGVLDEMAPSELRLLWDGFKEVNADFFGLADRLQIGRMLEDAMRAHWTQAFSGSLKPATETPGSTDGAPL